PIPCQVVSDSRNCFSGLGGNPPDVSERVHRQPEREILNLVQGEGSDRVFMLLRVYGVVVPEVEFALFVEEDSSILGGRDLLDDIPRLLGAVPERVHEPVTAPVSTDICPSSEVVLVVVRDELPELVPEHE